MPSHGFSSSSTGAGAQSSIRGALVPDAGGRTIKTDAGGEVPWPLFFFKIVQARPSRQKRLPTYLGGLKAHDLAITMHSAVQVCSGGAEGQAAVVVSASPVSGSGHSSSVLLWPFPPSVPHKTLRDALLSSELDQAVLVSVPNGFTSCRDDVVQPLLGRMLDHGAAELDDYDDLFASGQGRGLTLSSTDPSAAAELQCLRELQAKGAAKCLATTQRDGQEETRWVLSREGLGQLGVQHKISRPRLLLQHSVGTAASEWSVVHMLDFLMQDGWGHAAVPLVTRSGCVRASVRK